MYIICPFCQWQFFFFIMKWTKNFQIIFHISSSYTSRIFHMWIKFHTHVKCLGNVSCVFHTVQIFTHLFKMIFHCINKFIWIPQEFLVDVSKLRDLQDVKREATWTVEVGADNHTEILEKKKVKLAGDNISTDMFIQKRTKQVSVVWHFTSWT